MSALDPARDAEEYRTRAMRALGASVRAFSLFLEQQVGSRAASDDILRDAFVRSRRDVSRGSEQVCSWFYRSLRDAVLDQPRHTSSEGKLAAFRAELAQKLEPSVAMLDAIARHVGAVAATLEPEQANLLRRMDLEGEKPADYARGAGTSTSNVERLLEDARAELCRQILGSFGTCNAHGFLNCTCGASLGDYGRRQLGASR
jgi:RNA polymerase sigma-70 factor (ECF subfamily)